MKTLNINQEYIKKNIPKKIKALIDRSNFTDLILTGSDTCVLTFKVVICPYANNPEEIDLRQYKDPLEAKIGDKAILPFDGIEDYISRLEARVRELECTLRYDDAAYNL